MGKLEEIREKLVAGTAAKELVKQGYARSSVHHAAKKLKTIQPATPTSPVPDEIQELRHQRDIIKLQKEIAELEAMKERLPDRVAALELGLEGLDGLPERILFLEKQIERLLDAAEDLFFELLGFGMSVQFDDYGTWVRRKRTDKDRDLAEKKTGEFIRKYRLERTVQERDYN